MTFVVSINLSVRPCHVQIMMCKSGYLESEPRQFTVKNTTLYLRDITIYIKMGPRYLFSSKYNCWCKDNSFLLIQIVANSCNTMNSNIS